MPSWWNKKPPEEEKVEEKGVNEDKYASPWARARTKEALSEEKAKEEPINHQEMSDEEWRNLINSQMSLFFDDSQMRERGGLSVVNSFPDFLFQTEEGRAIWDEHVRRLGIDPNYLKPSVAVEEQNLENTDIQE